MLGAEILQADVPLEAMDGLADKDFSSGKEALSMGVNLQPSEMY